MRPVRRALLSTFDKSGLVPFAQALVERGVSLISTGGTARALREAGLEVANVSDITRFPEMMDGRVKTLHPAVHGGILARRDLDTHMDALKEHDLETIDLVVVNLYPFEAAIAQDGVTLPEAIEQIDVLFGPIGTEVKALFLASAPPLAIVGERELFHEGKDVGRLLRQLTGGEVLARANERDAMLETLVDLGPVFGVFLGQGVENRIRGGILAQGLFNSVDESVDIHGL